MDLAKKLLNKNIRDANIFAAKMMTILVGMLLICTMYYGLNDFADQTAASVKFLLLLVAIIPEIVVLCVSLYVLKRKGEGRLFEYILGTCLIFLAVCASLSMRAIVWPLFIFCVAYSVRYCSWKFTLSLGLLCIVLIFIETICFIPFGLAIGYVNMDFVELTQDAVLPVKAEYHGIYNSVIKNGQIDMELLYRHALGNLIAPLVTFGFISVVFSFISRYNKANIEIQIDDLKNIDELQHIAEDAGVEIWNIVMKKDAEPRLKVTEKVLSLLKENADHNLSEEEAYKIWFSHIKNTSVPDVLNFIEDVKNRGQAEFTYVWTHPIKGDIFVRCGGFCEKAGEDTYILKGYHSDINDIMKEDINQRRMLTEALEEAEKQKRMVEEALKKYEQADSDRRTDFLTGLRNRQDMFELLQNALSGIVKNITSMFMMDIDNFKMLNDHYGHATGDECLKKIGNAFLKYGKKNNMYFFRYGGEEFLGISFINSKTPAQIAEELVQLVRNLKIKRDDMDPGIVTISLGYTTQNKRYEKMIDKADTAMYAAKKLGKNRVVCFEEL